MSVPIENMECDSQGGNFHLGNTDLTSLKKEIVEEITQLFVVEIASLKKLIANQNKLIDNLRKEVNSMMIAVKSDLSSRQVLSGIKNIEHLFILVNIRNIKMIFSIVHFSPNSNYESYEIYCRSIDIVFERNSCDNFIFCGDYNFPGVSWQNDAFGTRAFDNVSRSSLLVSNYFTHLNFTHSNNIPNSVDGFLDLIFTNIINTEVESVNTPVLNCDVYHPALTFSLSAYEESIDVRGFDFNYYDFSNADYNAINHFLEVFDWDTLCTHGSVDFMVDELYNIVNSAFELYVPKCRPKRPKFPHWYSDELKKSIFDKKIAYKKYKENLTKTSYNQFSQLRSRCKEKASECYNDYISSVEDSIIDDNKAFW